MAKQTSKTDTPADIRNTTAQSGDNAILIKLIFYCWKIIIIFIIIIIIIIPVTFIIAYSAIIS